MREVSTMYHFLTIIPLQNVDEPNLDDYSTLQDDCVSDYLKQHPLNKLVRIGKVKRPLVQLLINPWTRDTLETVSPKVFHAINGKWPCPANLLNGRVRLHDAIDSIATELGYPDSDTLVNSISEVVK